MKKIVLLISLIIMGMAAMAQHPSLRFGSLNKEFNYRMAAHSQIVSVQGNEITLVTESTRSILGNVIPTGLQVVVVDSNLNILRSAPIPELAFGEKPAIALATPITLNSQVIATNFIDGRIFILFRAGEDIYSRCEFDPQTMTVVKNEVLPLAGNITPKNAGNHDKLYSWYAQSENKDFYSIVTILVNTVTNATSSLQLLLDDKFEIIWNKNYEVSSLQNTYVSNDGTLHLIGTAFNEKTNQTLISLSILDVDNQQTITHTYAGNIDNLAILNSLQGHVVAAGLVAKTDGKNKKYYEQIVGLSAEISSRQFHITTQDFTLEEKNAFSTKSSTFKHPADPTSLVFRHTIGTPNGGVALLQHHWTVYFFGGSTPNYYEIHAQGCLAMAVDIQGNITWHKPIRSNYFEKTSFIDDPVSFSNTFLRHINGRLYFGQPEAPKSAVDYTTAKALKPSFLPSKPHCTGLYEISDNGNITKTILSAPTNGTLSEEFYHISDSQFLTLFCGTKKSCFSYVSF